MQQSHVSPTQRATGQQDEEKRPGNDSRARRPFEPSTSEAQPTKSASRRQRWADLRPSKTAVFWYVLAAVALTMLVGFTWGGWMTSGAAQRMADTSANSAVTERLAPICVAQFHLDPDKDQKLQVLRETSSYQRAKYVTDQTWATMAGDEQPDRKVAEACAKLLMQIGE